MSKWIEQGIHALLHRGLHEVIHYAGHELPKVIDEIGKTFNKLSSSDTHDQQILQEQIRFNQIHKEEERLRRQEEVEFKQLLDREQSERLILLGAIRSLTQSSYIYKEFDNPPSVEEYYDTHRSLVMHGTYSKRFEGATVEALKKVLRLKEEEREARLKEEREARLKEERARLKAVIIFTSCFSALILGVFGGSLIYNNFVSNIETTETTSSQTAK